MMLIIAIAILVLYCALRLAQTDPHWINRHMPEEIHLLLMRDRLRAERYNRACMYSENYGLELEGKS